MLTNLREIRRARGLTQGQLARMCGVNITTIIRYEKQQADATTDKAATIAGALGCTLDELIMPKREKEEGP